MATQPDEDFKEVLQPINHERKQGSLDEIVLRLDKAYTKGWVKHLSKINEVLKGKDLETRQSRARALSTYTEVIELKNDSSIKYKLSDIHRAVLALTIEKPKLTTYNKFEEFVNRGSGRTYSDLLTYLGDKPRGTGNTKVGEGLKRLIFAFYADSRKLNFARIAELTSHAVRKEVEDCGIDLAIKKWNLPDTQKVREQLKSSSDYVSASTVKKIITPEIKNTYYRMRYGIKEFRQNQVTPIFRKRAEFPMDRVEFDSSVFSFMFYDNSTGKYSIRLNTCIVVDSFSGRIIGYAFAKSESAELTISAMRNAFSSIGYLPAEIFTDRFPGWNNAEAKYFFDQLKGLGCIINLERTGNARAKGLVEVTINNLCELAKDHSQFAGKNITTKSKDSRKSVEVMVKMTRADQRISIEEVKGMIVELIAFYNSRKAKGVDISRSDRFFTSNGFKNAIELTIEKQVWLFYKVAIKQVDQGCVIFKKGYDRFVYPISDHVNRLRLNGKTVKIRYRDEDLYSKNEVWLFDAATDELICTCSQQKSPMIAKVNQDDSDSELYKANTKKNKAYTSLIKQKEIEIDPLSVEVSNYLVSDKVDTTKIEELYLLQNMLERREAKLSMTAFEGEDKKLFAIVPDKKETIVLESKMDRLRGYEDEHELIELPDPIMTINHNK